MSEKEIKMFLADHGVGVNDRVDMPYGGIYLWRLLAMYEQEVKKDLKKSISKELVSTLDLKEFLTIKD